MANYYCIWGIKHLATWCYRKMIIFVLKSSYHHLVFYSLHPKNPHMKNPLCVNYKLRCFLFNSFLIPYWSLFCHAIVNYVLISKIACNISFVRPWTRQWVMSVSKAAEVRQHCQDEYVMQKTGNEVSVVQSSVWVTDSCHINVKIQIPAFVSTFRITQIFHPIPNPPYLSVSCFSFQRLFIASNLHHLFNVVNSKHRLK